LTVNGHVFASEWHIECAKDTPNLKYMIEKDAAFVGTVKSACRVRGIHVIVLAICTF